MMLEDTDLLVYRLSDQKPCAVLPTFLTNHRAYGTTISHDRKFLFLGGSDSGVLLQWDLEYLLTILLETDPSRLNQSGIYYTPNCDPTSDRQLPLFSDPEKVFGPKRRVVCLMPIEHPAITSKGTYALMPLTSGPWILTGHTTHVEVYNYEQQKFVGKVEIEGESFKSMATSPDDELLGITTTRAAELTLWKLRRSEKKGDSSPGVYELIASFPSLAGPIRFIPQLTEPKNQFWICGRDKSLKLCRAEEIAAVRDGKNKANLVVIASLERKETPHRIIAGKQRELIVEDYSTAQRIDVDPTDGAKLTWTNPPRCNDRLGEKLDFSSDNKLFSVIAGYDCWIYSAITGEVIRILPSSVYIGTLYTPFQ